LPGANLDGVHFPGPRVTLCADQPHSFARIVVYEAASTPNPLVVERHEVHIRIEPGIVSVREVLLLNNPSLVCYVGEPLHEGATPVTLHLDIPKEFERVIFDKESWGRQFRIVNDKLVTSLPFPPGQRELGFRYLIPHSESHGRWHRQLTLPCRSTRLTIEGTEAASARCNLPYRTVHQDGCVQFESEGGWPGAGDVIEVEFGAVPATISHRVRAIAVLVFGGLAIAVCVVALRERNHARRAGQASTPRSRRDGLGAVPSTRP
jgi:hypothetical protein